ncbi:MAG: MogA/MoaB family molybdenum cofactor biosynthesis protein [Synergistaceae bacterium]
MDRILRMYAPNLIRDHTLCYIHNDVSGKSSVNEVAIEIVYATAGVNIETEEYHDCLTLVLPQDVKIEDGDFLRVDEYETLLKWSGDRKAFTVVNSGFVSISSKIQILKPISVAVLTVSDKCSSGERIDTSGPELELLVEKIGGVVTDRKTVPDDMDEICATLKDWTEKKYNLILTTGGTGLAERDVTPEALLSVSEKIVPGFGELMRIKTLIDSPRAMLTRGLAVIRDKTVIVALPGSKKGASQCFNAISVGLRHGVETLLGISHNCGEHK